MVIQTFQISYSFLRSYKSFRLSGPLSQFTFRWFRVFQVLWFSSLGPLSQLQGTSEFFFQDKSRPREYNLLSRLNDINYCLKSQIVFFSLTSRIVMIPTSNHRLACLFSHMRQTVGFALVCFLFEVFFFHNFYLRQ